MQIAQGTQPNNPNFSPIKLPLGGTPPPAENTGIFSRIGSVVRFSLENLENFWFVPIGLVLMFGAGRRLIPLNVLVFGGGTLAGVILTSRYKGQFTKGEKRDIGTLISSAMMITAAAALVGVGVFALRQVPKAINYVSPIASGLTGLLTGRALIHRALGSTDIPEVTYRLGDEEYPDSTHLFWTPVIKKSVNGPFKQPRLKELSHDQIADWALE